MTWINRKEAATELRKPGLSIRIEEESTVWKSLGIQQAAQRVIGQWRELLALMERAGEMNPSWRTR